MIAPKIPDLVPEDFQKLCIDHAGMTVIFDHEKRLVRADFVQLLPGEELLLRHRVIGGTEGDHQLVMALRHKGPDHIQDLPIAFCRGNIQTGMKGCEAGEVDMAVAKGRNQRPAAQLHMGAAGILCRQLIAHMDDPAAVLHQIFVNMILGITGQDAAFVDFHGHNLHFLIWTNYITKRLSGQ